MPRFTFALLVLFFVAVVYAQTPMPDARGWNDNILWFSNEEGLKAAKAQNKPMMYVFHSTSCGACKRLKPDFASNELIEKMSQFYVMVNVQNQEEPSSESAFLHDGGYIPRIYFADPQGNPDYSVTSGNSKYLFFYSNSGAIAEQMVQFAKPYRTSA